VVEERERTAAAAAEAKRLRRENLARVSWVDSATGLMWSLHDNGLDLTWEQATSYCRSLNLGGADDWRLPEIGELKVLDASRRLASSRTWSATRFTSTTFASHWIFYIPGIVRGQVWSADSDRARALCVRRAEE
jgi:hypothetical protein